MGKTEKVAKVGIKKEAGYLYFVDKKGDISRAVMKRGGRMMAALLAMTPPETNVAARLISLPARL